MDDPVQSDDNKTHHIRQDAWQHGSQRRGKLTVVHFGETNIEDQQRDHDRKHTITKGFKSGFFHSAID